jgi:hypothetical protein
MSTNSSYTKIFNDHFIEFLDDMLRVFPDDIDLITAKKTVLSAKKMNPKILAKIWKIFVTDKYMDKINAGDISFFIEKDYSLDLENNKNADVIASVIDRLRKPIKNMGDQDQNKTMSYIQNLCKISLIIDN